MSIVRVEYTEGDSVVDSQRSSKFYTPPVPRKHDGLVLGDAEYVVYDVIHKPNNLERIMGQDSPLYIITVKIQRIG